MKLILKQPNLPSLTGIASDPEFTYWPEFGNNLNQRPQPPIPTAGELGREEGGEGGKGGTTHLEMEGDGRGPAGAIALAFG